MNSYASPFRKIIKTLPVYPMLRRLYYVGTTREHWARVVMNRETEQLVQGLSPSTQRTLEISGTKWSQTPFSSYKSVQYPDFDICNGPLDETFDLVIAEQVFEHLLWPYRAGQHVHSMLEPGGHFLITTPFLIRIHEHPTDCSRWTETGIKYFLAECGFPLEDIRTGSWGNRACVRENLVGWPSYRPWTHSLENEPHFPVVVWALAKKR